MKNGLPQRLNFQGHSVALDHLAPHVEVLSGHGPGGRDLYVRIIFQSHVFSRKAGDVVHDFLDEIGAKRVFCPDRYAFSRELPAICVEMLVQNVLTWEEKDRNGSANLAIITPAGAPLQSGTHPVVIYYLIPSGVDGLDVDLIVKTCYEKAINFDHRRRREKILKFVKMAYYQQCKMPKN